MLRDESLRASSTRHPIDNIRRVDTTHVPDAIGILREVAQWLIDRDLGLWSVDEFERDEFEAAAHAGELIIGFEGTEAAAVMLLQSLDALYWPSESRGAALYLHKLAVRRASAGRDWSHRMIEWAAAHARARAVARLRLDTVPGGVLQSLYEREGFVAVDRYPIWVQSAVVIRMERRLA